MESAAICLKTRKNLQVVTVDNNGNPAFLGATLYAKYQSVVKVQALIKLGDLVEVREKINPIPNLGHYILTDEDGFEERRLQQEVCIAKGRDVRSTEKSIIRRAPQEYRARTYRKCDMRVIYLSEGVEFLYVYDAEERKWETWCKNLKTERFEKATINYSLYIKNLVYREDISPLTQREKNGLNAML